MRLRGDGVKRLFTGGESGSAGNRASLIAAEAALGGGDDPAARERAVAADVFVFRDGKPPERGVESLPASTPPDSLPAPRWVREGAGVSAAGDLGYTWGRIEREGDDATAPPVVAGGYLRVWRREGDAWKVALDLASD